VKLVQKPLYFIFFFLFLVGCNNQPLTSTLLVSGLASSDQTITPGIGTGDDSGTLDIHPDNQDVSAMVEDTDKVEVSGSCNDLNRKKNRIIVEAFSGENENDTPYISNAISDFCQQTTLWGGVTPSTGNGTPIGAECFWVTKGIGIVEDANIPLSRKSYPQCHNGRFSFAVRLGGVLQNPAPNGSRYLIRFKIRTLEGQIAESTWSRVYVTRKLAVPSIDFIEENDNLYYCSLSMSPARFNQNILYTLTRAQQGASTVANFNLYTNQNSLITTAGNSTYSYSDDTTRASNIISGVTYTYTLTSTESTIYSGGFSYSPALTQTSEAKTCSVAKPSIEQPYQPTNVPIGSVVGCVAPNCPTGPTCYLRFASTRLINPGINSGKVTVRWAYSTSPGWTGVNSDYNGAIPGANGSGATIFQSTCGNNGACIANALAGDNLGANTSYYFAAQEIDVLNPGLRGKWSNEIECKPPSPQ
jgi:hypothetical protein